MAEQELKHYASKYYDPVKAHKYYEQHKKLKGRTSTKSLNDTGKEAAAYVKERINEEKKSRLESETERHSKEVSSENESYRKKVLQHTSSAKAKISSLQKKYSKLSPAQKRILGPSIKKELERIRSQNATQRNKLQTAHSNAIKSMNEKSSNTKKSLNEKYKNLYSNEVEKMKGDSSMVKTKKSKSTSEESKSAAYNKALGQIKKKTTWKK